MFTTTANSASLLPNIKKGPSISFEGVTDKLLLENIQNSVDIYQRVQALKKKDSIEQYEWQRLKSRANQQILEALKPYGYYRAKVLSVAEPRPRQLVFSISLGKPVSVRQLSLQVLGGAEELSEIQTWLTSFPLREGDPLVQPRYDAAKAELNRLMRRFGYFDAKFTQHQVAIDGQRTAADISLQLASGQRYHFGETSLVWPDPAQADIYSDKFMRRYLSFAEDQPFDLQNLQKTQNEMVASSYFSTVAIRPLIEQAVAGIVPLEATIELPRRLAYGASVGFGTDSGIRGGVSFENRRFNRRGHRLKAELLAASDKQSAILNYSLPINRSTRDSANIFASMVDETSDARDSQIWLTGFDISKSLSENTQLSYGISYRDERFLDAGSRVQTGLLLPAVSWQTVSAGDLHVSSSGYRLSATLRGADDGLGSDISFAQLTLNAKSVFPLGRGKLLGRAQIGQTMIKDDVRLPASLSFFTGGDHSVRGYRYESIGVSGRDGVLRGGTNMLAASIEYEHSVKGSFGLAAFVDAGDAYDNSLNIKIGVGVGARWRLPFGALRLDFASARDLPGQPTRVHFTFGSDL